MPAAVTPPIRSLSHAIAIAGSDWESVLLVQESASGVPFGEPGCVSAGRGAPSAGATGLAARSVRYTVHGTQCPVAGPALCCSALCTGYSVLCTHFSPGADATGLAKDTPGADATGLAQDRTASSGFVPHSCTFVAGEYHPHARIASAPTNTRTLDLRMNSHSRWLL